MFTNKTGRLIDRAFNLEILYAIVSALDSGEFCTTRVIDDVDLRPEMTVVFDHRDIGIEPKVVIIATVVVTYSRTNIIVSDKCNVLEDGVRNEHFGICDPDMLSKIRDRIHAIIKAYTEVWAIWEKRSASSNP